MANNNPALTTLLQELIASSRETLPIPEGLTPPGTPSVAMSEPRPEKSMMERISRYIPPELRELGRSIGSTGIAQEFKEAPIGTTLEFVGPGADVKVMRESSARVLPRLLEGDITGGLVDLGIAAASIPMMAIPGSLAWHSGPKKWAPEPEYPHGRPKLSEAGTGEGHSMRGWGFYAGGAKGTGKSYQDKFTYGETPFVSLSDKTILPSITPQGKVTKKSISLDGTKFDRSLKPHEVDPAYLIQRKLNAPSFKEELKFTYNNNISEAIKGIAEDYSTNFPLITPRIKFAKSEDTSKFLKAMKRISDDPNPTISKPEAPLYKMDIPDEDITNLLDWEKTLNQQPPKVQEALLNVDPKIQRGIDTYETLDGTYKPVWNDLLDGEFPIWEIDEQGITRLSDIHTGGSLYETLAKTDAHEALPAELPGSSWYKPDTFEKKHTSLWLKSLGIPGLKYLDQFSRKTDPRALGGVSAKEGATHNYVIWNQDVLNRTKMLERSGEKLAAETEKLVPVFPKPEKKQGGSIVERNPYTHNMRAI